jgi:hypothetical protein
MDDTMNDTGWEFGDPVFDKWLEQEATAGNEEVAKSTTNSPIWGNPSTSHRYETDRKINNEFNRIWENVRDSHLVRKVVPRMLLAAVDEKMASSGNFGKFRKTWLVSSLPASERLRKHHTTDIFILYLVQSVPLGCPIPRHLISHKSFRKLVVLRDLVAVPNQLSPMMTFPADHDRLSAKVLYPTGVAPDDSSLAIPSLGSYNSVKPCSAEQVAPAQSSDKHRTGSFDAQTAPTLPQNRFLANHHLSSLSLQPFAGSNLARPPTDEVLTPAKPSAAEHIRSASAEPGSSSATGHSTDRSITVAPLWSVPSLTAGPSADNNLKPASPLPTPSSAAGKQSATESMSSAPPQVPFAPQPAQPPKITKPKPPPLKRMKPVERYLPPGIQDRTANTLTAETGTMPPTPKVSQQDAPQITRADLFSAMNPFLLRSLPPAIEGLNTAMREGLPMEAPKEGLRRALLNALDEALKGGPQSLAGMGGIRPAIQPGAPLAADNAPLIASARVAAIDTVKEIMQGYQATFHQTVGKMSEVQTKMHATTTAQSSQIGALLTRCTENDNQLGDLRTKCAENTNQLGDLKTKCVGSMNQFNAVQAKCGQHEVKLAQQEVMLTQLNQGFAIMNQRLQQSEQINAINDAGIQNLYQMAGNLQMHERENIATVARLVGQNKAQDEQIKEQKDKLKAQEMRIRAQEDKNLIQDGRIAKLELLLRSRSEVGVQSKAPGS